MLHPTNPNHLSHTMKWPERWRPWTQERPRTCWMAYEQSTSKQPPLPPNMKTGKKIPLAKKGKSNIIMSNHRGITITWTLGKTYGHILKNKIGPLPQSALQFGFTEGLCPQMAVLCLTEPISKAKTNRSSLVVATLDSEKAYDVVSHPILFLYLFKKGIAPDIWLAMKEMYEGLIETVCWKNTYSRKYTIGLGVGQGKILSPLLYKVYADNLLQKLKDSGLGVYIGTTFVGSPTCADDVLLVSSKAPDMQSMLNINQSYSEERRYSTHPIKSEVSSCTWQDPNLMLDENKLPYTNAVTHLGLPRSLRNGSQTVQTRIGCARCSAYSLIPAGLHGENGLPPTASKKLITTYILPRLLYGLEAVTLLKKDLQALDLFYKDLLRNIQSLREGVTTTAIYLLIGLTPAEGELHIQILTLYGAKSRLPTNSPIKRLAERQLTFGQKGSWFIYMKDIALMYGMTEIILASLYASWDRIKWKHFITSTVSNYWFDKLAASYRAKMLTGSYILQSNRARFNQHEVDPTCPQCSATTDDIPQILMECPALKPAHDKHLPTLSNLCKSLDITVPKCKNEWCALILNCGDSQSCPHSGGQPKQWITIPCKCKKNLIKSANYLCMDVHNAHMNALQLLKVQAPGRPKHQRKLCP